MPDNSPITTYILTGGKSSRFGEDKLQFLLKEKPILHHVIESVSPFSEEIILVGNDAEKYGTAFQILKDSSNFEGPLAGIFSALSHHRKTDQLILAGDMPFLRTTEFRNYFSAANKSEKILIPETADHQKHFLHVLIKEKWNETLIEIIRKNPDLKSVHRLWVTFGIEIYQVPENEQIHYRNINQKSDLGT